MDLSYSYIHLQVPNRQKLGVAQTLIEVEHGMEVLKSSSVTTTYENQSCNLCLCASVSKQMFLLFLFDWLSRC